MEMLHRVDRRGGEKNMEKWERVADRAFDSTGRMGHSWGAASSLEDWLLKRDLFEGSF